MIYWALIRFETFRFLMLLWGKLDYLKLKLRWLLTSWNVIQMQVDTGNKSIIFFTFHSYRQIFNEDANYLKVGVPTNCSSFNNESEIKIISSTSLYFTLHCMCRPKPQKFPTKKCPSFLCFLCDFFLVFFHAWTESRLMGSLFCFKCTQWWIWISFRLKIYV
jgi:hypothetical protein